MRLHARACWQIMTPAIAARVDAWISDNIALLEPDGFREAIAFNLRYGWLGARRVWERSIATARGEAACRVAAAAMRGIMLELVRWAWGDEMLYAVVLDVTPSHGGNVLYRRWTVIQPSLNGSVIGMLEDEDEALVTALEAAPRQGEAT